MEATSISNVKRQTHDKSSIAELGFERVTVASEEEEEEKGGGGRSFSYEGEFFSPQIQYLL